MALNDIYRVTFSQVYTLLPPIMENVFYYKQVSEGEAEGAVALLPAFQTQMYPAIQAITNDSVSVISIDVQNIIPGVDNAIAQFSPGTNPGSRTGDCLPPHDCFAFTLFRVSSAVKNGAKRFPGVSETDQNDGVATGAILPLLDACATALAGIIGGPLPTSALFEPRIFRAGRPVKVIPAKTIPALAQADFAIADAGFSSLSTQTSRKFGKGQ